MDSGDATVPTRPTTAPAITLRGRAHAAGCDRLAIGGEQRRGFAFSILLPDCNVHILAQGLDVNRSSTSRLAICALARAFHARPTGTTAVRWLLIFAGARAQQVLCVVAVRKDACLISLGADHTTIFVRRQESAARPAEAATHEILRSIVILAGLLGGVEPATAVTAGSARRYPSQAGGIDPAKNVQSICCISAGDANIYQRCPDR